MLKWMAPGWLCWPAGCCSGRLCRAGMAGLHEHCPACCAHPCAGHCRGSPVACPAASACVTLMAQVRCRCARPAPQVVSPMHSVVHNLRSVAEAADQVGALGWGCRGPLVLAHWGWHLRLLVKPTPSLATSCSAALLALLAPALLPSPGPRRSAQPGSCARGATKGGGRQLLTWGWVVVWHGCAGDACGGQAARQAGGLWGPAAQVLLCQSAGARWVQQPLAAARGIGRGPALLSALPRGWPGLSCHHRQRCQQQRSPQWLCGTCCTDLAAPCGPASLPTACRQPRQKASSPGHCECVHQDLLQAQHATAVQEPAAHGAAMVAAWGAQGVRSRVLARGAGWGVAQGGMWRRGVAQGVWREGCGESGAARRVMW